MQSRLVLAHRGGQPVPAMVLNHQSWFPPPRNDLFFLDKKQPSPGAKTRARGHASVHALAALRQRVSASAAPAPGVGLRTRCSTCRSMRLFHTSGTPGRHLGSAGQQTASSNWFSCLNWFLNRKSIFFNQMQCQISTAIRGWENRFDVIDCATSRRKQNKKAPHTQTCIFVRVGGGLDASRGQKKV